MKLARKVKWTSMYAEGTVLRIRLLHVIHLAFWESILYDHFQNCCPTVDPNKLLQILSHGPNVNFKLIFQYYACKKWNVKMNNIYWYTLHNVLKHGEAATKWNLKSLNPVMFKIFYESSFRKVESEKLVWVTAQDYLLRFFACQWI